MVDFRALAAPFPPEEVYWRLGTVSVPKKRAMALAYIDARVVMDRLDDVCGPEGWQDKYPHAHTKTVCDIGIKCGDEWVWKSDGAGDSDIEAEKGSLSDAFKRAAVRWGIGRYLYHLKSPWVEVEETGQKQRDGKPVFRFTDGAKRELAAIAQRAAAPPPPASGPSSANGCRMAADEPHLIDNTRQKGKLPGSINTPEAAASAIHKIAWVKKAIDIFKDPATDEHVARDIWIEQKERIAVIETALPTEYERLLDAYNQALERKVAA